MRLGSFGLLGGEGSDGSGCCLQQQQHSLEAGFLCAVRLGLGREYYWTGWCACLHTLGYGSTGIPAAIESYSFLTCTVQYSVVVVGVHRHVSQCVLHHERNLQRLGNYVCMIEYCDHRQRLAQLRRSS